MPLRVAGSSAESLATCDYCSGKNGRNKQIVHILSRPNREALVAHLSQQFQGKPPQDFFLSLWDTAHMLYGTVAYERNQPLALVYLEAHGVNVKNKFDWITRHRSGL